MHRSLPTGEARRRRRGRSLRIAVAGAAGLIAIVVAPASAHRAAGDLPSCSQIAALGLEKQGNMRAGLTLIRCGLDPGGSPSRSRSPAAAKQIGGSDVDVITGTETYPHVTQSEDQIAVNGSTVVVNYNDSRDALSNPVNFSGVSVSTDGGVTFTRLLPSPFATGHGANFGDPSVVFDKSLGTWFAGDLAAGCGGQGIGLWTSANGTSWAAGACAHSGTQDDRPSMWVDNTPASPFYGRIYLTYNDFNVAGGALFATHSDDGVAWSSPVQLTPGFIGGLRVGVAADGTVLEAALDEGGGGFNPKQNFVYRSTDGGVSFSGAIATGAAYAAPGEAVSGFFTRMQPIWRNYGWGDLAVGSGGNAVLAYAVHGAGADGGDIYIVRSTDNGLNWGSPVRIDGDVSERGQWMPSVASAGMNFFVAWYDRRHTSDGVNYERWGTISTDGGTTWSTPDRISDVLIPQPEQPDPSIVSVYAGDYMRDVYESGNFYDGWTDGRTTVMDPVGAPHSQQDVFVDLVPVPPTAADVVSFAARASASGVELNWRTSSELRTLGFEVWRSAGRDGRLVEVTATMIHGKRAGTSEGARYRFVDRKAPRGRVVYRLRLVGLDGHPRFVGVARVASA